MIFIGKKSKDHVTLSCALEYKALLVVKLFERKFKGKSGFGRFFYFDFRWV